MLDLRRALRAQDEDEVRACSHSDEREEGRHRATRQDLPNLPFVLGTTFLREEASLLVALDRATTRVEKGLGTDRNRCRLGVGPLPSLHRLADCLDAGSEPCRLGPLASAIKIQSARPKSRPLSHNRRKLSFHLKNPRTNIGLASPPCSLCIWDLCAEFVLNPPRQSLKGAIVVFEKIRENIPKNAFRRLCPQIGQKVGNCLGHPFLLEEKMTDTEADWTKDIKSETVCQYFYVLFFIVAVFAGLVLLGDIAIAIRSPKMGAMVALRTLPTLLLAILNTLFLYILCARSLLK